MHRVLVSYHHCNDQFRNGGFDRDFPMLFDRFSDSGDRPDDWTGERPRCEIRGRYLKDSMVTTALVGTETRRGKHVEREIHVSMYDGHTDSRLGSGKPWSGLFRTRLLP